MTVNPDLFEGQLPRCEKCGLVLDKKHTVDECRKQAEFRRKARESFEALDWAPRGESDASP